MQIPYSLILSFLERPVPPLEAAEALTLLGIEVDKLLHPEPPFKGVVVGEVRAVNRHPEREKLAIADVFDGKQVVKIVCGAPNCRTGLKCPFAPAGALLPDGKGGMFTIGTAQFGSVSSPGMLCGADEIGLEGNPEGVLELPSEWAPGKELSSLLWDPVFELSFTPNFGHAMSALGIARELSACLQIPLRPFSEPERPAEPAPVKEWIANPALCSRYMGACMENVSIVPSPFWLQRLLYAAGHKPINAVVDVTNYILLKHGQPLHAFDADKLSLPLTVGKGASANQFDGLDGRSYPLFPDALCIFDRKGVVALAGVMGGAESAISDNTRRVFIEAASFDPLAVRKTAKLAGVRTDSSHRFEKGVDPAHTPVALAEAIRLIEELCGGKLAGSPIDASAIPRVVPIPLRFNQPQRILGAPLSLHEIRQLLERLSFRVEEGEKAFLVTPPSYRTDVLLEIDLIEEIARLYGYQNLPRSSPVSAVAPLPHDPRYLFANRLRAFCIGQGLTEMLNSDLIGPAQAELGFEHAISSKESRASLIRVLHAKSEEFSVLRPSLFPGLLQAALHNVDRKRKDLAVFEIGRVHWKEGDSIIETETVALLMAGSSRPAHWDRKPAPADFYDLKGVVENLIHSLSLPSVSFAPSERPTLHPTRQCEVRIGGEAIGSLGQIHPRLISRFSGMEEPLYYAELHTLPLLRHKDDRRIFAPLPAYPATERDWTLPLPPDLPSMAAMEAIRAFSSSLLEKVELIDLFPANGKNHTTFRFTYRDPAKTVSFEEAEEEHQRLIAFVSGQLSLS